VRIAVACVLFLLSAAPLAAQEKDPVSMKELLAAISKLRDSYDQADQRVREAVEQPAPLPADREHSLAAASTALAQLVKDMDALLEILPEPPPPPPSKNSGDEQKQSNPSSGDQQDPQSGKSPNKSQDGSDQAQQQGPVPPPSGPPLFGQPPANYGRWGLLPPRLQEALQNSAGTEVPARYRRWLEAYHRRGQQPR